MTSAVDAQNIFQRIDSTLAARYYRDKGIDTAYIMRPQTRWTLTARVNVSGSKIESEGVEGGVHFAAELKAQRKTTVSLGVNYLGLSVSASINPAKLFGNYSDYELAISSYGKRFGFDVIYQSAHNYSGWHDTDGYGRIWLPEDLLSLKALSANAFYVFNSRRFSFPAAFSQSYIQRRSAGGFMLTASFQGQRADVNGLQTVQLKTTNVGIGAGYGYNFVPERHWLLHISALPTFVVFSNATLTVEDSRSRLRYHFPEAIITGRGAAIYQWRNMFLSLSMVYNFTAIGHKESLSIHNTNWRVRATYGLRLGRMKN